MILLYLSMIAGTLSLICAVIALHLEIKNFKKLKKSSFRRYT
jgi:hypothetical protein